MTGGGVAEYIDFFEYIELLPLLICSIVFCIQYRHVPHSGEIYETIHPLVIQNT